MCWLCRIPEPTKRPQFILYLICVVHLVESSPLTNRLGANHLCNEIPLPSPLMTAGRQAKA
jgi:hypothetical protein